MKYIIFTLLLFMCLPALPQKNKVTVSGKVVHAQSKEALEFATISLQDINKPEFLTGGVTNTSGDFSFEVPTGTYLLKVEFLSFKTHEQKEVSITKDLNLGTILLAEDAAVMEGIEIVAEKTTTEFRLDKKVFNVGKDLIAKGGSVNDVLQNVPSVTVDAEGAINLRGNTNVRILINGKPSIITSNNGLDQIPANSIERVEVITNPSARYEAQGSAGIINIILKKNSLEGFSGSVQLRTGYPADHRPTLSLNYKAKKLNLFSTVGYRYSNYIGKLKSTQQSTRNAATENLQQTMHQDRNDNSYNFYIGGDYSFNDKNVLTLSAYRFHTKNTDYTLMNYDYSDEDLNPTNQIVRTEDYLEPQTYNQWELNYAKTFDKKGQKFTFSMEYDFWNDDENENITSTTTFPSISEQKIHSRDIESSKDFLIQTDYVQPLSETAQLELGIRAETRIITSDYTAQTFENNNWEIFNGLDNELDYYEKIAGAYIQYGNKKDKLGYQIGLRSEYTAIRIEDLNNEFGTEKNYLRFFPTVHLTYALSEDRTMQLSYSRRINRPSFWQLNPFGGLSDFRNLRGGNPDLDPSYTNALEFGLLSHGEKFTINPSVYYQVSTDFFFGITQQLDDGNFFHSPTNQTEETRWGLELSTSYQPFAWWTLNGDFNFYQVLQKGSFNELDLSNTNNTWFARVNSRMNLPKSITIQATFNYFGRNQNAQTTRVGLYHADIAISKDLLKEKATLTLNVRNLLDSRNYRWTTVGDGFWQQTERTPFGRRWAATFAYRFNQKKNQRERRPSRSNR